MASPTIVDANVILRFFLADHDVYFPKARVFFERVKNGIQTAYISEGVLVECVYVLLKVYGVPRKEVSACLKTLLGFRGIVAENKVLLQRSLSVFGERNVDIVDAIIWVTGRTRDWPIFSFDRDIDKLCRAGPPDHAKDG